MRRLEWLILALMLAAPQLTGGPRAITTQHDLSIRQALDRGDYENAERRATSWYTEIEQTYGPEALELAHAADLLVEALLKNGKSRSATILDLAERAVRLKEGRRGAHHIDLAPSLHNLGSLHASRGEFPRALAIHERALALRRLVGGEPLPAIADSLNLVAFTLISLERFQTAQSLLEEALPIRQRRSSEEPLGLARTLELIGLTQLRVGRYREAEASVASALTLWEQHAPGHPGKISVLLLRSSVAYLGGDVLGARRISGDAARLASEVLRPDHPMMAFVQRSLAVGEDAVGNTAESRRLREDAMRIAEQFLPTCDPEVSAALNELGRARMDEGDFAAARTLYRRKASNVEKCFGPFNDAMATTVYNQFDAAREMGAFAEAEALGNRAINLWSKVLGPTHPFVGFGAYQLATFEASRKRYARAGVLFEQSLTIRRKALGAKHPDVALTLIPYSRMLVELGRRARAESLLQEAIDILAVAPSRFANAKARALEVQALLQRQQGDFKAVRTTLAEALTERERIYGANHPYVASTRAELASADLALAKYDVALASALSVEESGRDVLRFTVRSLPERRAMEFAAARPRGLDLVLSIAAGGHASNTSAVLDSLMQSRGVVLDEVAARAQSTTNGDARLAALTRARERVASLTVRSLRGDTVPAAVLDEAQKQKEDAEEALAEQSPAMRAELARSKAGLDDMRRAMPPRSALISFARYDRTTFTTASSRTTSRVVPSYIAFVARAGDDTIASVPLGSAGVVDDAIAKWRAEVDGRTLSAAASPADAERAYRLAGARLRTRVWDPLAKHLGDIDRVFIVPDGAVNTISFSALPTGGGKYLIESAPVIHYLTTERDLIDTGSAGSAGSTGSGLLAVGGPAYGQPPTAKSTSGALAGGRGPLVFEELPGTMAEVQDIARLWGSAQAPIGGPLSKPTVLSGRAANKGSVMRMAAGRRVLHLATHGFFLGSARTSLPANTRAVGGLVPVQSKSVEDNPLLLSGLALAGANQGSTKPASDNGILTAEEIVALNLQGTEWAVLSACDTGLGQIKAGEGVFGLRRAFQIAGVRTVITSLWSVEDQTTRLWMRTLYEGRLQKNLSTADAVRAAGLRVLRDRRSRGQSAHPFYWGAFVAAGDWR